MRPKRSERRYVRVITEAEAGFPHAVAMREGARSILAEYDDPPEGGTLVPRLWVVEHLDELRAAAEVEQQILGDLSNFRPTGFVQVPEAVTTAQGDVVSDSAYVEENVNTLADVVAQYRELREARAKLAAVETLAREIFGSAKHSDYGDGRWDVADRIMRILDRRL